MSASGREEALWLRTVRAAALSAEARTERDRGAPAVTSGDVFLLGDGDHAQEWVVLRVESEAGRALAAPADVHPLAGAADVALGSDAPSGPLTLRCRLASWIATGWLDPARRSGWIQAETVARALDRWEALQAGTLSDAIAEADLDPEYHELIEQTAARARSVQTSAPPGRAPAAANAPARSAPGSWLPASPRWRPALLPTFSVLLVAVAVWQAGRNAALREDLRRVEADSSGRAAERRRPPPASPMAAPLVNVPLAWLAPREAMRGEAAEPTVRPAADHFFLVLEIPDRAPPGEYLLEAWRRGEGAPVLTLAGVRRGPGGSSTVALPRAALPEGRYRLVLRRAGSPGGEAVHEYTLRLAAPAATSSPR